MDIWILTVRSHRYHPNRRLLEAAGRLKQKASLIHPGKIHLIVNGHRLSMGGRFFKRSPDLLIPRLGATIKERKRKKAIQNFIFNNPTKIIFGKGQVPKIGKEIGRAHV